MSGDKEVVVLNLDTKEFVNYLREHPSVQKSMDSVMSSNFLFSPSGKSGSYSGYINTLNSWYDKDHHNTILVDKDHQVFLGTGQLQHPRVAQGNDGYPYIVNLGVNPNFRKRGLGGKLLSQLKEQEAEWILYRQVKYCRRQRTCPVYRENGFTRVVKPGNTDIPTRIIDGFMRHLQIHQRKKLPVVVKKTGRKCGKRDRSGTGKNKGKHTNSRRTLKRVGKRVGKRVSRSRH